jgi:hypothetical protein
LSKKVRVGTSQVVLYVFQLLNTNQFLLALFIQVWSPAGGWWNNPANWKANTGIAAGVVGVLMIGLFQVSSARERRPIPPVRHIPSQYWCKYAAVDDPRLAAKK